MRFPFGPDQTYTIGALRAFERELLAARQADQALSRKWRVPGTAEDRRWAKLREETLPIKMLADHKAYSDGATFRLKPYAFPGVDAELNVGRQFALQITIADPVWMSEHDRIQHGGYDHRLAMEALNRDGVVIGSGNFQRDGSKIVCDEPVIHGSGRIDACRKGLIAALARKATPNVQPTTRLLVHTRAYAIQTIDRGYGSVVSDALREFRSACNGRPIPFAAVYFVDQDEFFEFSPAQQE